MTQTHTNHDNAPDQGPRFFVNIEGTNVNLTASAQLKAEGSAGAEVSSGGTTDVKGSLVQIN